MSSPLSFLACGLGKPCLRFDSHNDEGPQSDEPMLLYFGASLNWFQTSPIAKKRAKEIGIELTA
jgi:hypothetical protein